MDASPVAGSPVVADPVVADPVVGGARADVVVGVLGPVVVHDASGEGVGLGGRRHQEVLARLVVARGRVVPVGVLVEDLWEGLPPAGAVAAVRTFVAVLRRRLEPARPPRAPARVLVTEGGGYALRLGPDGLDVAVVERALELARSAPPAQALDALSAARGAWRGEPFAGLPDLPWLAAERTRLHELRVRVEELRARALVDAGDPGAAVPELRGHVAAHPWREEAWHLLALALARAGRRREALDVLRAARARLVDELGLDPSTGLRRLERELLEATGGQDAGGHGPGDLWERAVSAYGAAVGPGSRARLRSSASLAGAMAVSAGPGPAASRDQRLAAVLAAERSGDGRLLAEVVGGYAVPALWARSDDAAQASRVVEAAERALVQLGPAAAAGLRGRLLATVAVELRGTGDVRGPRAARRAEALARQVGDPALLVLALNGALLQAHARAGLAPERHRLAREVVEVSRRADLPTYEVLGHLALVQACAALRRPDEAERHAAAADALGRAHESPLVEVFTGGYRLLRRSVDGTPREEVLAGHRAVDASLQDAGMPGVREGLLPLALLSADLSPTSSGVAGVAGVAGDPAVDWGPHEPWARPHVLLARGEEGAAARALRAVPDPPPDHLLEALWCVTASAALRLRDTASARRCRDALAPALGEDAAGSGLVGLGPVDGWVRALDELLAGGAQAPT